MNKILKIFKAKNSNINLNKIISFKLKYKHLLYKNYNLSKNLF